MPTYMMLWTDLFLDSYRKHYLNGSGKTSTMVFKITVIQRAAVAVESGKRTQRRF